MILRINKSLEREKINIITINSKRVGDKSKNLSSKRIFSSRKLDIIFVKETMVSGDKDRIFFVPLLLGWELTTIDMLGLFGGLLVVWNHRKGIFSYFQNLAGILLTGDYVGFASQLKMVKCYPPYSEREYYWEKVKSDGI